MQASTLIAMSITLLLTVPLVAAVVVLTILSVRAYKDRNALRKKWGPAISVDDEVTELTKERDTLVGEIEQLRSDYTEKRAIYSRLKKEVAVYDEKLSFAELGVYEPHFEFSDSEDYKAKKETAKERQKGMVKAKIAVICNTEWSVDGSKAKGRTMINRNIRLTLRAFNNECEAAIANARWNNVNAMERRIVKAAEQIDKMNRSNKVIIAERYIRLKLKELYLTHEYKEARKREKDERIERNRLEREDKKREQAARRAEREEERYRKLLAKAKKEALESIDARNAEEFERRIEELEQNLQEANEKLQRARSMAEQTRAGYVYIVSNIGSFGDDVVKIGMTRRLNPDDRVRELGDASVPFRFDTHALVYTEDAPATETALHEKFDDRRVNGVNRRKEFFRVDLEEVEATIKELDPRVEFIRRREAQEYMETTALREQQIQVVDEEEFPESI